jgi:hypothetical protein
MLPLPMPIEQEDAATPDAEESDAVRYRITFLSDWLLKRYGHMILFTDERDISEPKERKRRW